jgi:hypothetical protein
MAEERVALKCRAGRGREARLGTSRAPLQRITGKRLHVVTLRLTREELDLLRRQAAPYGSISELIRSKAFKAVEGDEA